MERIYLNSKILLKPVLVKEGVSDGSFSQIVDGGELEGKEAVIGYETVSTMAAKKDGDTTNPFMPKRKHRSTAGTAPEPRKPDVRKPAPDRK